MTTLSQSLYIFSELFGLNLKPEIDTDLMGYLARMHTLPTYLVLIQLSTCTTWTNSRFAQYCHLTTTTRIPFVFLYYLNLEPQCSFDKQLFFFFTYKTEKVKDYSSCSQMTPSCKLPIDSKTPSCLCSHCSFFDSY